MPPKTPHVLANALDLAILSGLAATVGYCWGGVPAWLLAVLIALWLASLLVHLRWWHGP